MKVYMECSASDLLRDDPFDSIDDLLDFPNEDVLAMMDACGEGAPLTPPLPLAANASASDAGGCALCVSGGIDVHPAVIAGGVINSEEDAVGLCNDTDIANLEWLSNFFEDSEFNFNLPVMVSTAVATTGFNTIKNDFLFQSLSPTSVLEHNTLSAIGGGGGGGGGSSYSTSSCSSSTSVGGGDMTTRPLSSTNATNTLVVPARARTKRPRPQFVYTRSFVPPPSSDLAIIATPTQSFESETVGESFPAPLKGKMKKKVVSSSFGEDNFVGGMPSFPAVRKCMHCDIQKTPQWRAGPMGPKTLCNACGVRYKSGRLFPEYRPAASPTFIPSIHSNSHKKVVEMRLRVTQIAVRPPEGTVASKNCDLLEYIRRRV